MTEWREMRVGDCLAPVASETASKVQSRDYKVAGKYPVVDQGKGLVAGWTDNAASVIRKSGPVVVFGDHTRALKYVDFPFARGADGTQILKPVAGIGPRFFYFALRALDIPSRGYNRHFQLLRDSIIRVPREDEQAQVASVLSCFELAIAVQAQEVRAAGELKRETMQALFTRGLRGEPQKDSEVGQVPASWVIEPVSRRHSVVSGGTPSRSRSEYWAGGTIPWVKTSEIDYQPIVETEEAITPKALTDSAARMLPAGTLLMAMYGQGVTRGKVAILGIRATCNQACAAIRATQPGVSPAFLYHFLSYRYDAIRVLAHGGQQQNLSLEIVKSLPLAVPSEPGEQDEVSHILDAVDRKLDLHRRKRAVLDKLFKALLHKLMTGEIRVTDLDLDALIAATPGAGATA